MEAPPLRYCKPTSSQLSLGFFCKPKTKVTIKNNPFISHYQKNHICCLLICHWGESWVFSVNHEALCLSHLATWLCQGGKRKLISYFSHETHGFASKPRRGYEEKCQITLEFSPGPTQNNMRPKTII